MRDVRKLLRFVDPYRALAVASLVLLFSVVLMDLAIPRLLQRIVDQGIFRNDRRVVLETALVMLCLSGLSTIFAIGNNMFSVRVGEGVARDLREALFLKIQTYSFGNLDRQRTGQLMVRLTSDVAAVKQLTQMSLRIGTRAPLVMIGSLVLMIRTSMRLALTMLPLLLVTTGVIVFFVVRMEPLFRLVQQKLDALNTVLQENIAGARLVKGMVRAEYESDRFGRANGEMTARSIRVMQFMSAMQPLLTLCVNIGMVVVIWSGGRQSVRGDLSVGQVIAFTNYLLTAMTPLVMMTMLSNMWAAGIASARRVNEIFDTVPEVLDGPDAKDLPLDASPRVVLDDVTFAYRGDASEPVLSDITLSVERGQTIAILGSTGAGKSTLVSLIPRFYDPTSGTVRFDTRDLRSVRQESILAHVAVVPQESILFSGTVRDNIRYGRPDASEDDVIRAARDAEAHDFITRLSKGYDTHVEQRGANLSGGQKQRIAIARALLLDPDILILDDSTSAVDVETETRIQEALERRGRHTTFVVAQRISTVLNADRIVVLDKGRIVAQGTHRELMDSSAVYREIYDSQLGHGVAIEAAAALHANEGGA